MNLFTQGTSMLTSDPIKTIHILLVDDDEVDRMSARRALKRAGWTGQITEAADGQTALTLVQQQLFDCIMLDFHLPDCTGLQVLEKLHQAGLSTPVVMMTGQQDARAVADLMKAGAADYLPKDSLTGDGLAQSISRAIRLHRAEQQAQQAQAELRATADKLAYAQSIGRMGNWEWHIPTNQIIWSDALYHLFGLPLSQEPPTRTLFRSLIHPDDYPIVENGAQAVLQGTSYNLEYRIVRPDKQQLYMHSWAELTLDEAGQPLRLVGVTQDITERKQAELILNRLYQVMATPYDSLEEELTNALKVGVEMLEVQMGIISRVEGDDYIVQYAYAQAGGLQPEQRLSLKQTLCEIVYQTDNLVTIEDVANSLYRNHPCYQNFGLETFIAIPLYVEGHRYGTLNFSSTAVRPTPFTKGEKEFLLLMGQWVSSELERQFAADKLAASEAQFRTLVSNIPGITYRSLLDETWTKLFMSEATHDITGYATADFLHNQERTFNSLIHPDDKQRVDEAARYSLHEEQLVNVEYRIIHANGQTRWVHDKGRVVFDHAGHPLYLDGLILDITKEKEATERLRILDRAIAYSSAGVAIADARNYAQLPIEYVNDAFSQITGYTHAELIGKSVRDLYDYASPDHTGFEILREGVRELRPVNAVLPARRRDGTHYWSEIWLAPVFDDNNQLSHFVATHLDVTRRQEAEEQQRALLEAIPDLMFRLDHQGTYLDYHAPKSELLLVDPQTFLGRPQNEVLPPHLATILNNALTQVIATGKANQFDYQLEVSAGMRDFEGRIVPINAQEVLVLVRDITRRKQAEAALQAYAEQLAIARDQALEASKYKSLLLGKVSHELRTPLGGILGYAELLHDGLAGDLLPEQEEFVTQIVQGAHHLNGLITDLLDQARIEQGTLNIEEKPLNVSRMVNFLHGLLQPLASQKGLELALRAEMPDLIVGDEKRLRQIIINLASNAIKFTSTGTVSIYLAQDSDKIWRIEIADSGPGIPEEAKDKIFGTFWQVDSSASSQYKGYGLGLSIVYNLVQMMGGWIEVDSTLGQGSTFTVWLPLKTP